MHTDGITGRSSVLLVPALFGHTTHIAHTHTQNRCCSYVPNICFILDFRCSMQIYWQVIQHSAASSTANVYCLLGATAAAAAADRMSYWPKNITHAAVLQCRSPFQTQNTTFVLAHFLIGVYLVAVVVVVSQLMLTHSETSAAYVFVSSALVDHFARARAILSSFLCVYFSFSGYTLCICMFLMIDLLLVVF